MKAFCLLFLSFLFLLPIHAQNTGPDSNPLNITRQGFGDQAFLNMGVGFVNPKMRTEGSAYYFEDWDTEGIIYLTEGRYKINNVNINLHDSKLEALYDDNNVFTFNSENLARIMINDKVFRPFEINKQLKILELFFEPLSIYRYLSVAYVAGSKNPMHGRSTNKYIKKTDYYTYKDGELTDLSLSKKSFSVQFQNEKVSQEQILDYIKQFRLSLNDEEDLLKVLEFISR